MNFILKQILNQILNLIYPPKCGICGKLHNNYLCKKCEKMLINEANFTIDNYEEDTEKYFSEHIYLFKYQGIIRKEIINYKFNGKSYLYKSFVNFLLKNEKLFGKIQTYDIITSVPISKKRYRERGYNQSKLIAQEIAKKANKSYIEDCLIKVNNNVPQSTLNKENRQQNVIGMYKVKNTNNIENKKILIIDDIFTTGATVNECCKILSMVNVEKLGVFTLAKD